MNEYLEVVSVVVQACLALFALWYTIETRNLRKHSTKQLKVLERQHTVAVAPYLIVSLATKAEIIEDLKKQPEEILDLPENELSSEAIKYIKELEGNPNNVYLCHVGNPTSKIALDVEVLIYDTVTKNFTLSYEGLTVIGEKDEEILEASSEPMTEKEAVNDLCSEIPRIRSQLENLIKYEEESYILVIFRDIEQGTYGIKRSFKVDEDGESHMFANELIVFS